MESRKAEEQDFHDTARGEGALPSPNSRFYHLGRVNHEFHRRWLLERCRGKRVLDFCCGAGATAIWLAESGAEAYGIDISRVSIERGREEAERRGVGRKVKLIVGDAENTGFEDGFFDCINASGVLHHLDLDRAYAELARILKPDGEIVAVEALRHNILIRAYRRMTPRLRTAWETDHILGKSEIERAKKYFHRVRVDRFFHLATLGAIPFIGRPGFSSLLSILEGVDSVLLRIPGLRWQAWTVAFVMAQPKERVSPPVK